MALHRRDCGRDPENLKTRRDELRQLGVATEHIDACTNAGMLGRLFQQVHEMFPNSENHWFAACRLGEDVIPPQTLTTCSLAGFCAFLPDIWWVYGDFSLLFHKCWG